MSISFATLVEQLNKGDILMTSGEESKAMQAVRAGNNLSPDFWNQFMSLCSNADGLSELFNINKDRVLAMPTRIKENLKKVENKDSQNGDEKESMLSTGE